MYVYIDESCDHKYFFLAAVLTPVESEVTECIRIARSRIRQMNKNSKRKLNLQEIKESKLFRQFPEIKESIIHDLVFRNQGKKVSYRPDIEVIGVFHNREKSLIEEHAIYTQLAIALLSSAKLPENEIVDVMFDQYGDYLFKERLYALIRNEIPDLQLHLHHEDSSQYWQLQVADLVVGTLRRKLWSEDVINNKVISPIVKSIREITLETRGITRSPGVPSIMP